MCNAYVRRLLFCSHLSTPLLCSPFHRFALSRGASNIRNSVFNPCEDAINDMELHGGKCWQENRPTKEEATDHFFFSLLLAFSNRKYMHLPVSPHIRLGPARFFSRTTAWRRTAKLNISVENILCNFIEYQKAIKHMHRGIANGFDLV